MTSPPGRTRPRRSRSFRIGDRCEGLGCELLRSFALVAPVPRPEDVGIDAYATLLRQDGPYVTPENPFLVQFKSSGTRRVPRDGYIDMGWLRGLRTPFWICSIELRKGVAQLYSTLSATRHLNAKDIRQVAFQVGGRGRGSRKGDTMVTRLAEPVFEFTFEEAGQPDFADRAYALLKPILEHEQHNLGLPQDLNMVFPSEGGFMQLHDPARLKEELIAIKPALQYLLGVCAFNEKRLHVSAALLVVAEFFEESGVQVRDPFMAVMAETLRRATKT